MHAQTFREWLAETGAFLAKFIPYKISLYTMTLCITSVYHYCVLHSFDLFKILPVYYYSIFDTH